MNETAPINPDAPLDAPATVAADGPAAAPTPTPQPAPAPNPAPTPTVNTPKTPERAAPAPEDERLGQLTTENEQLTRQLTALKLGVAPDKVDDFVALAASRITDKLPLDKAMAAVLADYPAFTGTPASLGGASNPGAGSQEDAVRAKIRAAVRGE